MSNTIDQNKALGDSEDQQKQKQKEISNDSNDTELKKEVRSLKIRTGTLENIVRDKDNDIRTLRAEINGLQERILREQYMNNILMKFGYDPSSKPTMEMNENNSSLEAGVNNIDHATMPPCRHVAKPSSPIQESDDNVPISQPSPMEHIQLKLVGDNINNQTDKDEEVEIDIPVDNSLTMIDKQLPSDDNFESQPRYTSNFQGEKLMENNTKSCNRTHNNRRVRKYKKAGNKHDTVHPMNDSADSQTMRQPTDEEAHAKKDGEVSNSSKLTKNRKKGKWCYYELYEKKSCKFGDECRFRHDVPDNGKQIMQNWFDKQKQKVGNKRKDLVEWSTKLSERTKHKRSEIHHFLVNIMKELISKELLSCQMMRID